MAELEGMRAITDGPYGDTAKIDVMRQMVMMKAIMTREAEVREKNEEIQQLQQEMDQTQVYFFVDAYMQTCMCFGFNIFF